MSVCVYAVECHELPFPMHLIVTLGEVRSSKGGSFGLGALGFACISVTCCRMWRCAFCVQTL